MRAYQAQNPAHRHGDWHLGLRGLGALFRLEHRRLWSVGPQILVLSSPETAFVMFGPIVRHFVPARFVEVHCHALCDFQIPWFLFALSANETVRLFGRWAQLDLVVPVGLEEAGRWLWD